MNHFQKSNQQLLQHLLFPESSKRHKYDNTDLPTQPPKVKEKYTENCHLCNIVHNKAMHSWFVILFSYRYSNYLFDNISYLSALNSGRLFILEIVFTHQFYFCSSILCNACSPFLLVFAEELIEQVNIQFWSFPIAIQRKLCQNSHIDKHLINFMLSIYIEAILGTEGLKCSFQCYKLSIQPYLQKHSKITI